jgi:hypothetical protein
MMPHCLALKKKIKQHCLALKKKIKQVVTIVAHLDQSLFRAFPRMTSTALQMTWDIVIADEDLDESVEGLKQMFVASLLLT